MPQGMLAGSMKQPLIFGRVDSDIHRDEPGDHSALHGDVDPALIIRVSDPFESFRPFDHLPELCVCGIVRCEYLFEYVDGLWTVHVARLMYRI